MLRYESLKPVSKVPVSRTFGWLFMDEEEVGDDSLCGVEWSEREAIA
jgi:hypothetical protein